MIMKTYFLTYGDRKFYISKKHLISLAKKSELFDYQISLGPEDLNYEFKKKYQHILNQARGGGYWIWKQEIISNLLNSINKNDLVIYCDAGASLNLSKKAKERYYEYLSLLNDSDYSHFRMMCENGFIEKYYTGKEIFNYFNTNIDSNIGNSLQLQAGHMIFKNNQESKDYFKEYKQLLQKKSSLITDDLNSERQIEGFKENRHDQSIFSLLSKIRGAVIIPNETEFRKRPDEQYNFPFLSVRSYGHGPRDYFKYFLNPKKFTNNTVFFN